MFYLEKESVGKKNKKKLYEREREREREREMFEL